MIQYLYLGRVSYDDGLRLQAEIAALRLAGRVHNVLLLLEHPPVLTLGRNARRSNVLASDEMLASRGVTLHEINRGGDVTYHGPGQLVGYPIFDLRSLRNTSIGAPDDRSSSSGQSGGRLGPVDFVRRMEEALIRLCGVYGVRAARIPGLTGVWCPGAAHASPLDETGDSANPRKIAAIGIHVARGITSHGFALNVTTDLRDFELIVPCGIADHGVTSLARETHDPAALPDLESIAHQAARQFGQVFAQPVLAVESLDALRAHAASKCEEAAAPQPPQDTPLAIPPEVQRLHGAPEKPVRA